MNDPVIEVNHLFFSYEGTPVLEDVSLRISRGEFTALIGPNGAGKTTLIRIILGLLPIQRGEVRVFGKPPQELGKLRHKIGYIPQLPHFDPHFPITLREFVLTGRYGLIGVGKRPRKSDWDAVDRALEAAHLSPLSTRSLGELSGGQRQRALIARALSTEPEVLLCDEPTMAVDPQNNESFYELLLRLKGKGTTIFVISHDVGVVAQYADSIACLNRTLFCHQRPEEVITPEMLEALYGKEAAFFHHGEVPHIVVRKSAPSCSEALKEGERPSSP